jgi:lipoprotein-anchoring transpeptidase ErfK/SrfK
VGANERLDDIAKQLDVPTQLLANINGVADPDVLLPGTELKTVRGPFRAEVDLDRRSLTLFLNDLYAGRFPIFVGNDPIPESGEYQVLDKQSGRTYYGPGGRSIPVGDPSNPYGKVWLDLGRGVCIHGSPDSAGPGVPPGCIQLSPIDARDIYAILSAGSSVTIRR